jgi:hypothetical protein
VALRPAYIIHGEYIMKTKIFTLFLFLTFILSGCGSSSSTTSTGKKKTSAYIFNYEQKTVWNVLIKVLEEKRFRTDIPDPLKYELSTEKIVLSKDDIDTFLKLKEIGDVPKSPLSEYFEANYSLVIKLIPDDEKTQIEIENKIQALERGRYNKWIDIKSNGAKEKEIMALLLKRLKESE